MVGTGTRLIGRVSRCRKRGAHAASDYFSFCPRIAPHASSLLIRQHFVPNYLSKLPSICPHSTFFSSGIFVFYSAIFLFPIFISPTLVFLSVRFGSVRNNQLILSPTPASLSVHFGRARTVRISPYILRINSLLFFIQNRPKLF